MPALFRPQAVRSCALSVGAMLGAPLLTAGSALAARAVPLPRNHWHLPRLRRNLRHENIVRYLRTEVDDENLYIFTEWISGGSIADVVKRFGPLGSEETARQYTGDMLRGLEFLHANGIIHRDIKVSHGGREGEAAAAGGLG